MIIAEYNRTAAVEYAKRWWNKRNPTYHNFDKIGGDCTSFVSQCLFAGCLKMNYTKNIGWYYNGINDRAPAWTDVDYFFNFVTKNFTDKIGNGTGPFGTQETLQNIDIGDFVQLGKNKTDYYHSAIIVGFDNKIPLVSAHTNDAYLKPLNAYKFNYVRFIHILGVRK